MKDQIAPLNSILSEAQFMEALRFELLTPESPSGVSAVMRIRVNTYMAVVSLVGESDATNMLLLPSGNRLQQCVRSSDLVAQAKAGVFLVLLRNMYSEDDLERICERIIRAGKRPYQIAGAQIYSGFNIGAAVVSGESSNAISLVADATAAMYRRNRYGEGGFDLFPDELAEKDSDPLEIESYIRDALRTDRFELDFQPQYRRDGTLIGAGVLIRMHSLEGKRLRGEAFLRRVEDRELAVQMSERVLRQLCYQAGDWLRRGVPIRSLSMGVADSLFLQRDFTKMVAKLLRDAGVPGEVLELELTESTIMTDFETATETMTNLATLGVRFVLCGVSPGPFLSSYLPRLPIGTLQLSCPSNTTPSVGSIPLLRAAISQGHRLGLRVTSKDVQSMLQLTALRAAQCDGFQGSFLSEPLSKENMEAVLLTWNSDLKKAV
jgi:EAL domain-containing protein (putative c-di-GMP-specific phosphodiesterase class I)/GGDEF domain-containing protein